MAAAIPFAIKAGSMIGGALLGKKLSGPNAQQKAGMQGTQDAMGALGGAARPLLTQGLGMAQQGNQNLGGAADYYSGVMGSRSRALGTLSPEISSVMDYYKGSEGKLGRSLRGGSRDNALAEMERQKVGQVAGLVPMARRVAAEGLGQIGGQRIGGGAALSSQGIGAASASGQLGNALYGQGTSMAEQQQKAGGTMGNFLYDILGAKFGGGGGSSGGGGASSIYSLPGLISQNKPSAGL